VPVNVPAPVDPSVPVGLRPLSQVFATDSGPSPFQLRLQYTGEAWANNGGLQTGNTYLQNGFASLKIDTEKAYGWTGGRFVAEGFYNYGNSLNENFVGSVQDPSALDVGNRNLLRLYQVYYDQQLGNTNIRFGVMDLETEFGVTRPMDAYFSGAFAWTSTLDASGQRGLNGPSTYPDTALGVRIRQQLSDQWSVQAAVVNGMADRGGASPQSNSIDFNSRFGALAIAEVDLCPSHAPSSWRVTGRTPACRTRKTNSPKAVRYARSAAARAPTSAGQPVFTQSRTRADWTHSLISVLATRR
jgi:porin